MCLDLQDQCVLSMFSLHKTNLGVPTHAMEHIYFVLDSRDMTVSLIEEKHDNSFNCTNKMLKQNWLVMREVVMVRKTRMSNPLAVDYHELFYALLVAGKGHCIESESREF